MKTKWIVSTLLAALLLLGSFGCQSAAQSASAPASADVQTAAEPTASVPEYATFGDLLSDPAVITESSAFDGMSCYYIQIFHKDDVYYRAIALNVDEERMDQLFNLDWNDPDYDAKERELLAPIAIDRIENLTAQVPPQEELDKLIGKTGKELLDDDWSIDGYNLDETEFTMSKGMFQYTVVFDGKLAYSDDFDEDQAIQPLTVKSVTFSGISMNATDLETEEP